MVKVVNEPKRQYQTVDQALKVITDAEKFGGSVKVNKSGDLERSNSSTNPLKNIFLFFRKEPALKTQHREVIDTVLNKMKIEIIQASSYARSVNSLMEIQMNDLKKFKETGQLNQLKDQWSILKNTIAAAENGSEKSQDLLKSVTEITTADGVYKPKHIHQDKKTLEQISANVYAKLKIAEANLCLPASMPKIKNTGEVVKGTLTISSEAQLNLFNEWPEWDTHHNAVGKTSGDPFIGLSKAFQKDADRMNYVFESKGVAVECDRDKETVAIGFKQISGKNPMRQLILSHLLGQEAIKSMFEKIQSANPNSDGIPVVLFGTNTPGETKCRMHMTANDNGDVEIDYLHLSKSKNIGNMKMTAEINRSEKFDGPLHRENAATCMTMKIHLKNSDLNRGELKFTVIEPLKLDVQVEIPHEKNNA